MNIFKKAFAGLSILGIAFSVTAPIAEAQLAYPSYSVPGSFSYAYGNTAPVVQTFTRKTSGLTRYCNLLRIRNARTPSFCPETLTQSVSTPVARIPRAPAYLYYPTYTRSTTSYTPYYRSSTSYSNTQKGAYANVKTYNGRALDQVGPEAIKLMTIGISNPGLTTSSFPETIKLSEMNFKVFSKVVSGVDYSNFQLLVDGTSYDVNRDGSVRVNLSNKRITEGDSTSYEIALRLKANTNGYYPEIDGSFRVRLVDIKSYQEYARTATPIRIDGDTESESVAFQPLITQTGTNITVMAESIYGTTLAAGTKGTLLIGRLESEFSDIYVNELTIHELASSGTASQFVDRVELVNINTNTVIDTAFFNGSTAKFNGLGQKFFARLGQEFRFGIRVILDDKITTSASTTKLQIEIKANDIEIYSAVSGNEIGNQLKQVNLKSDLFRVSNATLDINHSNDYDVIANNSLNPVYGFSVSNTGYRGVVLGRFTLDLTAYGVDFTNGISADDFAVRQVVSGRLRGNSLFNATINGSRVTFDAISPVAISQNQSAEFAVEMKLSPIGGNETDTMVVDWVDDTVLSSGTFIQVQSSGARFIWSDMSDNIFGFNSDDWQSGYQIPLPITVSIN